MGVEPTVHGFADRCQQPVGVTADYVPPPGFEPGLWVPKTRVLPFTPRRNVRERIGHVCPTAFRHADPTRFADWIPGPIPWPNTLLIG